ncbi:unnamed protein product [Linum tenue]|uniref:RING-type domain-containing protein n=1 Tax=Linum tenue TaxID=586396 RepID=A0AAV0I2M2_9ROSI|nr:unnamed protein product [Linum tenue]
MRDVEEKNGDEKIPSPSSRESNGGHCPICLGSFIQESYLDTCFHKFCFKCILQWSKVVAGKHSGVQSSVKCPLCKEEDVDIIVHHILGVIDSSLRRDDLLNQKKPPVVKQQEFRDLMSETVRPFVTARAERFVDELELFLASGFNLKGYDEVYTEQLGWKVPGIRRIVREEEEEQESDDEHPPTVLPLLYISDEDPDV